MDTRKQFEDIFNAILLTRRARRSRGCNFDEFTDDPIANNMLHAIANLEDCLNDLRKERGVD
jgi:phage baseplate assembly protein W